jgi:hypothetical protein
MTHEQRDALRIAHDALGEKLNKFSADNFRLSTWRTPEAAAEYVMLSKAYKEIGSMLAQKELL